MERCQEQEDKADQKRKACAKPEISTTSKTVLEMVTQEFDEAYEKYVHDMTSEEAQRELMDIFILSVMLAAKIRKLSNARIIKDGGALGRIYRRARYNAKTI